MHLFMSYALKLNCIKLICRKLKEKFIYFFKLIKIYKFFKYKIASLYFIYL